MRVGCGRVVRIIARLALDGGWSGAAGAGVEQAWDGSEAGISGLGASYERGELR
jgi:hypothetical protein